VIDSELLWLQLEPLLKRHEKLRSVEGAETTRACKALFERIKPLALAYANALEKEGEVS
jgi:hypothetical protein